MHFIRRTPSCKPSKNSIRTPSCKPSKKSIYPLEMEFWILFLFYLMKVLVLCLFVVAAFSLFSEDLTKKYSIEVLQQGEEGTLPKKGDQVKMHYAGTLKDGTEFDSSYKRNDPLPLSIGTGQVIKCWDEVGLNMEVGTKVRVLCPSNTAYGSRGVGPIPANSDLIFVIERVE